MDQILFGAAENIAPVQRAGAQKSREQALLNGRETPPEGKIRNEPATSGNARSL